MDINKIYEKRLREAMTKVREGRAAFVKNVSACEIDRDNVKLYRLEDGEELLVDKELDTHLLDSMNTNKNIEVETVCSGHNEGPAIGFNYKGKRTISDVKNTLTAIPNTNITYNSQIVKMAIPLKNEFKIKRDGEEYTLFDIEETHQDYFFIKGTKKGSKAWWGKVSNILSKLK